jgi:thiamine biosynthesis lipoprotein
MAISGMPLTQRRIRAERIMGTVISIDVRGMEVPEAAIDQAFQWLREVDARFSTYRADSEVSRLGRGELVLADCHPDVAEVLALCEEVRGESGGAFNAWRARHDGRLDPSGVVKGWSVDRAAAMLEAYGARNFCINAGGDIVARGVPDVGRNWRIGIRHPHDRDSVAVVLEVTDLAVATSGSYERGAHILDPRTGDAARGLLSLTVAAPDVTRADAYATAGFAMGEAGIAWAARQSGCSAYGITNTGRVRYSEGFAQLIAR